MKKLTDTDKIEKNVSEGCKDPKTTLDYKLGNDDGLGFER